MTFSRMNPFRGGRLEAPLRPAIGRFSFTTTSAKFSQPFQSLPDIKTGNPTFAVVYRNQELSYAGTHFHRPGHRETHSPPKTLKSASPDVQHRLQPSDSKPLIRREKNKRDSGRLRLRRPAGPITPRLVRVVTPR
jgi:hypothetical protein